MKSILEMNRQELLALDPDDVMLPLTAEEVIHIATVFGAFWTYDYEAADRGKVGLHALLKSGLHSDGFFVSKILLGPRNIRRIIAAQIVNRLRKARMFIPDYVAGVPDGAAKLGEEIAEILGVKSAKFEKVEGRIIFRTQLEPGASLLLVEDFCTRGTGFKEAVIAVGNDQPNVGIVPLNPVILNRGGLKTIIVENVGTFRVIPVIEWRVNDWNPDTEKCPLCAVGSKPIKPKETDENWRLITNSQK